MKRIESRHWIFIGLFLLIAAVMLLGVELNINPSSETQKMYDYIENLPPGSTLMISFDHEASSLPEIRPVALAILRHAFSKGHKLVGLALFAEGTVIGYRLMDRVATEYGLEYGRDYAYLGFKPQYIAAILSMGESIQETFPEDYLGRSIDEIPLMNGIYNYDQIGGVISIADGSLTTHWMEYGAARYNVDILAGVTAAMVTTYDPYLASNQMQALVGGLRGAAEYERLTGRRGGGSRGMLAQTTSHLYVLLLILLGNIAFIRSRRKGNN
ncbi:MAG: hypothetical protein P1R58_11460 [bacterium]|nr:hypothetical protein [bacterium]